MSDITTGDKVTIGDKRQYNVLHIHQDWAWVEPVEGLTVGHLRRLEYLTKLAPVFEAGKTYRGSTDPSAHTATVVDANAQWAIGWWDDGQPWVRDQGARLRWVEVKS